MPVSHSIPTSTAMINTVDVLCVRDLHFSYPDGHSALHGVSFKMNNGEKAALVGPNGAGKSTLMLHLNGILYGQGQSACDPCHGGGRLPEPGRPAFFTYGL
jgi:ABC-type multidrug transport system fused ATPase/permease subunit